VRGIALAVASSCAPSALPHDSLPSPGPSHSTALGQRRPETTLHDLRYETGTPSHACASRRPRQTPRRPTDGALAPRGQRPHHSQALPRYRRRPGTMITAYAALTDRASHSLHLAHYLRRDADVLAVGSAADATSSPPSHSLTTVRHRCRINEDIIAPSTTPSATSRGHLDRNTRVTFVNDEARSFIAAPRTSSTSSRFPHRQPGPTAAAPSSLPKTPSTPAKPGAIFFNHLTMTASSPSRAGTSKDRPAKPTAFHARRRQPSRPRNRRPRQHSPSSQEVQLASGEWTRDEKAKHRTLLVSLVRSAIRDVDTIENVCRPNGLRTSSSPA